MRIHHLDCGPLGGGMVTHCLLIEHDRGLVLVDTGYGTADIAEPARRMGWSRHFLRIRADADTTAVARLRGLGFEPGDVTDIVLTHLDYDHAGGVSDFPRARVHIHGPELRAATDAALVDRPRYRDAQWAHGPRWVVNEPSGDVWFGLRGVTRLAGLPGEFVVVPLYGHTSGHVGVAVGDEAGWLLHAGDAFLSGADLGRSRGAVVAAMYGRPGPRAMRDRVRNVRALAELAAADSGVTVFSSHDGAAFARLAGTA
ncbi:MBL fold metallo-hydrolase [Nocardia thailandica]